ncbi:MAG: cob(I)yrinic acid a,c-diamide adenosyltransferase, partial [Oscillospiraceae bacterium]|nr:cob(I)yrinic acid a,c-diamide adenosyltransferase [Oscillospiraceae bacterium]
MGLIHIYCGDGKGKTTASIGLALRAVGAGMKVHFVQFMKGNHSSELNVLETLPNLTVERCDKNYGFTFNMSQDEKTALIQCHNRLIKNAFNNNCDLLILDEFNTAYHYNL